MHINGRDVAGDGSGNEQFEMRHATLKQRVAKAIYEEPAERLEMHKIDHSCAVTNQVLTTLATINKKPNGFEKLTFWCWNTLDEKVSQTVVDQFAQHCRHLKKLEVAGSDAFDEKFGFKTEADRRNMCDLVAKILDVQAED